MTSIFSKRSHKSIRAIIGMAANVPIKIWNELKQQTILLFRSFLEFSDDKMDRRQHNFRIDYTTSQNAFLFVNILKIFCHVNLNDSIRKKWRICFSNRNFSRNYQVRHSRYTRMKSLYDWISACRFFRQLFDTALSKVKSAYANDSLESSHIIVAHHQLAV